jgi:PAS domain S-box-containing protein
MAPLQHVARFAFLCLLLMLVSVPLLLPTPLPAQVHGGPQRVLILHSYHQGYVWTDEVQAAFSATLAQSGLPIEVHVKYLDVTRFTDPKPLRRNLELRSRQLVDQFVGKVFDMVLVSDNAALDFVLEHREPLTGNAPIVFCGINNFSPDMLRGQANITGVAETPSFDATMALALKLHPKASKLLVLAEDTPTGKANLVLLHAQSSHFSSRLQIEVLKETDIHTLEARLAGLGPEWLVLPMVRPLDEHGVLSAPEASQRLSRASTVPLFAAWDFWMGHGPVAGVVVTAKSQGQAAAAMAIRVLKGERAESIPVVRQENNITMADHNAMTRFGMSESLLPESTEILNAPVSFYAVNKDVFWTGGAASLCLLILSIFLALNVSRRKKAEALYLGQLNFVETLLRAMPAPVFFKDIEGRYLGVNLAFEALMGKPAQDFIGRLPSEAFPQEHGQVFVQRDQELAKLGDMQRYEHVMPTALGLRTLAITKTVFPSEKGSPAGIVGMLDDITDRNAAERALVMSEQRFRSLFDEMTSGFALHEIICDEQGRPVNYRFLEVNPAFEQQTGLTAAAVVGRTALEVMPQTEPIWIERFGQVALSGEPAEFEEYAGALGCWYEAKVFSPAQGQFAVIFKDTTARKMSQLKLLESEERFRMLASESPVSIISFDTQGVVTFVSRWHLLEFAKDRLGEDFFIGLKVWELPSITSSGLSASVRSILDGECLNLHEVHVPSTCIGEETYQNMRGVPFRQGGEVIGGVLIRENITDRKRAREALRVSEERLRLAMEATSDGLWDWDFVSGKVYWSPRAYTMLGYEPDEFSVNFDAWKSMIHPEDQAVVAKEVSKLMGQSEGGFQAEFRLRNKAGGHQWIIARGKVVEHDEHGALLRMVGTHLDITEGKLATEALEREALRRSILMQKSHDGIAIINQEHRIVEANESFAEMLGYSPEEVIGLYTWDYETMMTEEQIRISFADLPSINVAFETVHRRKDGSLVDVEVSASGADIGAQPMVFTICRDITRRKMGEQELLHAKGLAESASRAKSEFLANMSHEIRTPLNGMLGMLQLIRASGVTGELEMYAEMANRAGERLTSLLGDILDLSRIEAGQMLLGSQPFLLANIFTALAETFFPTNYSKHLNFDIITTPGLPTCLVGDEVRVRQVLFNLVGNAMKFADHGEVKLAVSSLLPRPSGLARLLFIVSDNGPGIPDVKLDQICAPFVQVSQDYTRSHQGAGLGLAIVKRLVDLMGGTLTFESTMGQGTNVYLTLPFTLSTQPFAPVAPLPRQVEEKSASLRLLLVEDEEVSRLSAFMILKRMGHEVVTAKDGLEALSVVRRDNFDCILMDVQMPVMDGVEATKRIRSGSSGTLNAQVPIIAITAYAMTGDREKFLEAGMNDYVAKPVQVEDLKKALERVVEKRGKREIQ